jgi:hypothetical protein
MECSPPQLNQNRLHCLISGPVGKARQFGWVDHTVPGVDTWEVDFADELDRRWLIGIRITTVHLQRVNSVFVDALEGL